MLNGWLAVWGGVELSATCAVKGKVPAVVGVPEIAPVAVFNDSPAGRPEAMFQVRVPVPPAAVKVWL
jgi:hypothetical protein